MIRIYSLINSFFLILFSFAVFANEDVDSFCFPKNESVVLISQEISFLQTENDKIQINGTSNCLDIYTSSNRIGLYQKYIYKKYHPIKSNATEEVENLTNQNCQIEFSEKYFENKNEKEISIGEKNKLKNQDDQQFQKITSTIMISKGKSAELKLNEKILNVECIKTETGKYNLHFYIGNKKTTSLSSTITLNAGELVDVGSIYRSMQKESKAIGIPNSIGTKINGQELTKYELKVL